MYEWTVMIYMAGDNNLDSNGVADIKEIKRIGSTPEVAIIAQFDRSGARRHTKRYHLHDYATSPTVAQDEVEDLGETNTGSVKVFADFLDWSINKFAAKRYLVILWGHGSGALDDDVYYEGGRVWKRGGKRHGIFHPIRKDVSSLGFTFVADELVGDGGEEKGIRALPTLIAPDDEAKDFLDNVELKKALKATGRKIDILGMDACLMSMAEVCHQVRESVGLTVASEAEEELEGWPYEGFLKQLVKNPKISPEELADVIVNEFINLYSDHDNIVASLSACDLSKSSEVAAAVNKLAETLLPLLDDEQVLDSVMVSRYRVWSDEIIESVDLYDFCYLLRKSSHRADVRAACETVMKVIENSGFIVSFKGIGKGMQYCRGLGIYFPQTAVSAHYHNLDFVKEDGTLWGEFLKGYVKATER